MPTSPGNLSSLQTLGSRPSNLTAIFTITTPIPITVLPSDSHTPGISPNDQKGPSSQILRSPSPQVTGVSFELGILGTI